MPSQGSHPLVEADEAANPLTATASAADSVPGAEAGLSADSASEVMRAALAAEAEEVEELAQKVWTLRQQPHVFCGCAHGAAAPHCRAWRRPDSKQSKTFLDAFKKHDAECCRRSDRIHFPKNESATRCRRPARRRRWPSCGRA